MAAPKTIKVTEFKELGLLKALSSKANLDRYLPHVKQHTVLAETWQVLQEYVKYYKQYPDKEELDFASFGTWFGTTHGSYKEDKLKFFLKVIENIEKADDDKVNDLLHHFSRLDTAVKIRDTAERYITGSVPDLGSAIHSILDEHVKEESLYGASGDESELFISQDAGVLCEALMGKGSGFKWSLDVLNKAFGPMHLGDFGCIMARPNGGKTTLMVQEALNFLLEMDPEAKCIIFNNEELGEKIGLYAYKNLLRQGLPWIAANYARATKDFEAKLGGRKFYVKDDSTMTTWKAEKLIDRVKPKIICFNLLGKIKGFDKDDDLVKLIKLYRWGREIGKRYKAIVIATHQADTSAEGQPYMTQQQLFGSKTEVQGELDVLMAVGRTHDVASLTKRSLSACKNKQPESSGMDPLFREGPLGEVPFDGDTAHFG